MAARRRTMAAAAAAVIVVATLAASCTSSPHQSGPPPRPKDAIKGGIVTLANIRFAGATWILPLAPIADYSQVNLQDFIDLMYRPLYTFGANSTTSARPTPGATWTCRCCSHPGPERADRG